MAIAHPLFDSFSIRQVPVSRPFVWLREGWDDLLHHRGASLAYGWLVATLGALILAYNRHPLFIMAVIIGFLLVGPVLTAGLCELSRCRDNGEPANFQTSLHPLRRNPDNLLNFAGTLGLLAVVWFAFSGSLFFGLTGAVAPSLESTVWGDIMGQVNDTQLIGYLAIGILLAAIVFALSVVTVPMIVDRHVDARTAMRTSLRVTLRDLPAMLVWAALVTGLVLLGFATALVGMVVIFPLLGHATWRAYRELVE